MRTTTRLATLASLSLALIAGCTGNPAEPTATSAPSPQLTASPTAGPSPSPTPTATATASPTPSPSPTATAPPTATPSPTATPTQPPDDAASRLLWQRGETIAGVEESEIDIDRLLGFDGGYILFQRIVGSEGQWATRLLSSADGDSWRSASIDEASLVEAAASNGGQVLAVVNAHDQQETVAWITSDGRSWQHAGQIGSDLTARAVWATSDGWQGVFLEVESGTGCPYGCVEATLWESRNGSTWTRVSSVPLESGGDVESASGSADGRIVVTADQGLVISTDSGRTWRTPSRTRGCYSGYTTRILPPDLTDLPRWVIYGGGPLACALAADLASWQSGELPATGELRYTGDVVATPHGLLAIANRECPSTTDCPPFFGQFLSPDGLTWTRLDAATEHLAYAQQLVVADGPQGVLAIATSPGRMPLGVTVWWLVEER